MTNEELYNKLTTELNVVTKGLNVVSKKHDSTNSILLEVHKKTNTIKPIDWQGTKSELCQFLYIIKNNNKANCSIKELVKHFTYKGKEIEPESIYNLQNKLNTDIDYKGNESFERQLFESLE